MSKFRKTQLNLFRGFDLVHKIGMVTIGQSPRIDVIPEMKKVLGPDFQVLECGALDELSLEQVKKLTPRFNSFVLVSRMRDGTEVMLDKNLLIDRIQVCIDKLNMMDVDLIVILCTGDFPEFSSKKGIIRPSRIIYNLVTAIMSHGRLGVLVPSSDQIQEMKERWMKTGLEVFVESASPYGNVDKIWGSAKKLMLHDVDLIVMDCIGYSERMVQKVRKLTDRPVICPHSLTMKIVKELI